MRKPIIGIVSCLNDENKKSPFSKRYYVLNNYSKIIEKVGGIPIGILFNDEKNIKKSLDLCDGFLIPGGSNILDSYYEIINFAIKNKIPLLGICMGMQAIANFSVPEKNKNLILVKNHYDDINDFDQKNKLTHDIRINKDSILYHILKKDIIKVNSIHKYKVKGVAYPFKISALANDGVIEAVEYTYKNNFILGVQWHPELMPSMFNLFKFFINRCKK